jgi:ribosomal protein L9
MEKAKNRRVVQKQHFRAVGEKKPSREVDLKRFGKKTSKSVTADIKCPGSDLTRKSIELDDEM